MDMLSRRTKAHGREGVSSEYRVKEESPRCFDSSDGRFLLLDKRWSDHWGLIIRNNNNNNWHSCIGLPVGLHRRWCCGGLFIAVKKVREVRKRGQGTKRFGHLVDQGRGLGLDVSHETDEYCGEHEHVQQLPLVIHLGWRSGWCNPTMMKRLLWWYLWGGAVLIY